MEMYVHVTILLWNDLVMALVFMCRHPFGDMTCIRILCLIK